MPTIKPDSAAIQQYYRTLKEAEGQGALHEGNVRAAFENLLRETARDVKGWSLVNELGERRERNRVEYDGVLRDGNRLPHGYWEAKDTHDDLETEIRKKRDRGYRFDNIIFEDTRVAVLFQDNLEVVQRDLHQPEQVADLLNRFYDHEIEPFYQFEMFLAYKAEALGKEVVFVDARYTSQKCSQCGHIYKGNRHSSRFHCVRCGFRAHAAVNAAINVRDTHLLSTAERSVEQAAVNQPNATGYGSVASRWACPGGH